MSIIILKDESKLEPAYWMHCQYGHHQTCGGMFARVAGEINSFGETKVACGCRCHRHPDVIARERTSVLEFIAHYQGLLAQLDARAEELE